MQPLLSVAGLFSAFGLSSAAGLNAYVPLLIVGVVARYTNFWQLQAPYDALASAPVLLVLTLLAVVDFIGDKVPVVDHALHAVGTIVHPVAGAIMFASHNNVLTGMHPVIAMLAGVIVAGGFHASRAAVRPIATATTAGIGNPVLSFIEDVFSALLSVLAIFAPIVAFVVFIALLLVALSAWQRVRRGVFRP